MTGKVQWRYSVILVPLLLSFNIWWTNIDRLIAAWLPRWVLNWIDVYIIGLIIHCVSLLCLLYCSSIQILQLLLQNFVLQSHQ